MCRQHSGHMLRLERGLFCGARLVKGYLEVAASFAVALEVAANLACRCSSAFVSTHGSKERGQWPRGLPQGREHPKTTATSDFQVQAADGGGGR